MEITIPKNALPEEVGPITLTYQLEPRPPLENNYIVVASFSLNYTPQDIQIRLLNPAVLRVNIGIKVEPDYQGPFLFQDFGAFGAIIVPALYDPATGYMTGVTNHFGKFFVIYQRERFYHYLPVVLKQSISGW